MSAKTRGIILHTTNYSETSLVVKIYTEQHGLGSYIVSGVRSKNSRFKSNLFQPLSLVEIVASGKPGQSMKRITDVQLSPPFMEIPGDIIKSSIAIFLSEVIYRSIREEEPNASLFHFLHTSIQILDLSHLNCSRFHLFFMIQFSRYLGFYPHGEWHERSSLFDLKEGVFITSPPPHPCFLDHYHSKLLYLMMNTGFENHSTVIIPSKSMKLLLQSLVTYFEIHHTHGNPIKSHTVLEEILN